MSPTMHRDYSKHATIPINWGCPVASAQDRYGIKVNRN